MNTIGLAITLINAVATVLYLLILARILISWLPVSPWNPVVRWLRIIVDPILRPFRRILPSFAGIDFSPILAVVVVYLVASIATQVLVSFEFGVPTHIGATVIALVGTLLERILLILGVLVLIRLLVSLLSADPYHPLVMGIHRLTDPLVRPFAHLGQRRPRVYSPHRTMLDVPALITLIVYIVLYVVISFVFGTLLANAF